MAGWLFILFIFFPKLLTKTFPMVRFEPGTFHSASERLNHKATPEPQLQMLPVYEAISAFYVEPLDGTRYLCGYNETKKINDKNVSGRHNPTQVP